MQQEFEEVTVIDFKKKKPKIDKEGQKEKKVQEEKQKLQKQDNQKRYKQLLYRIVDTLNKNNPDLAQKTKILLKPPVVERIGSKKTAIKNFLDICKQLDRDHVHVMNFFLLDLGASGSMGDSGFVLKNILHQKNVENMFRKYITEFVQCHICKRQNTELVKDDKMRLWTLQCNNCKSSRTVPTIKGSKKEKKNEDQDKSQATTEHTKQAPENHTQVKNQA